MSPTVPTRARTIVVGGGVLGTSIAYHLAAAGERDVLLLEQTAISGGSTWHAAGMVGRMRPNGTLAKLNDLSIRLYKGLAAATGVETEWRECGTLYVARVADRMVQYRRQRALVAQFGIDVELVGPDEAADLFPLQHRDDLVGGIYVPGDGKVEPAMLGRALAAGAVQAGATVIEGVRITGLVRRGHRVVGVETADGGTIEAEHVVLANGMWARDLALTASVDVPLAPVQHHYAVSNPVSDFTAEEMDTWPCTRDTDGAIYYRTEGSQIWLGAFQEYTKPWLVDPVPHPFSFELLEPDWEHFAPPQRQGEHRLPILKQVGYERFVNGPESFTPDGNFLLGPSTAPGLWIAAGMNSAGIAFAGGAGWALASWITEGVPPLDLSALDPARFSPAENGLTFLRARVTEALGTHYTMAWPGRELETARPLRVSPLHERTAADGACFGQKAGIERPNWFGTETIAPVQTYGWGREPWFDAVRGEHLACREQAAIFDQSGFGKIEVAGADVDGRAQPPVCERRRRRTRERRLHRDARRPRGVHLRPHRDPPRRGPLPADHGHCAARARPRDGHERRERGRGRELRRRRRHARLCGDRADGSVEPRDPRPRSPTSTCRTRPSHSARRARSRSATSVASRSASRTSASSAGSYTSAPTRPASSTTRSPPRARRTACAPRATTRSTPCASRRPTAPGATSSRPT